MLLKTWLKKHKTSLANRISAPKENGSERKEDDDDNDSDEDDQLIETEGFSDSGD